MKSQQSSFYFIMALSVCFTLTLVFIRAFITSQFIYVFYVWNLLLAIVPVAISNRLLRQKSFGIKSYLLIFTWLIFFPNAPYIVTDLFHFVKRDGIPLWFDLLIVTTAAWNGLMLGFISLSNVEKFLLKYFVQTKVKLLLAVSLLLCGFGVYLGRFLRFNSWDVFSNFDELIFEVSHRFIHPFQYTSIWGFSFLFAMMIAIFYELLKKVAAQITMINN